MCRVVSFYSSTVSTLLVRVHNRNVLSTTTYILHLIFVWLVSTTVHGFAHSPYVVEVLDLRSLDKVDADSFYSLDPTAYNYLSNLASWLVACLSLIKIIQINLKIFTAALVNFKCLSTWQLNLTTITTNRRTTNKTVNASVSVQQINKISVK